MNEKDNRCSATTSEQRNYAVKGANGEQLATIELKADGLEGKPTVFIQCYHSTSLPVELGAIAEVIENAGKDLEASNLANGITEGGVYVAREKAMAGEPAEAVPSHNQDMFGAVCANSTGAVGIVTAFKKLPWGYAYVGYNLDTGERWSSRSPIVIAASIAHFITNRELVAWNRGIDGRTMGGDPMTERAALAQQRADERQPVAA